MSGQVAPAGLTQQAAEGGVLLKLVMFSVSLALGPITTYFVSEKYLWNGNSTYAALSAVLVANAVLVGYIIMSLQDDRSSSTTRPKETESRKER